jgi:GT2 family glycosyltransferase
MADGVHVGISKPDREIISHNGDPEVSVVIITLCRPELYGLLEELRKQETSRDYEIILVAQNHFDEARIGPNHYRLIEAPQEKGIPYYRNLGMKHAKGEVVAYIDDDEMPMDQKWLDNLVKPIFEAKEEVATSGTHIPTGEGFLADLISSLGFPGGGSIGFKNMWQVDGDRYTDHICTGNFAIKKDVLEKVGGFDESLKHGAEDTHLMVKIKENGIRVSYVEEATIHHKPRKRFLDYMNWQVRRGKSAYELKSIKGLERSHITTRISSSLRIIKENLSTPRGLAVMGMVVLEYLFQAVGYFKEMLNSRRL